MFSSRKRQPQVEALPIRLRAFQPAIEVAIYQAMTKRAAESPQERQEREVREAADAVWARAR